MGKRKHNEKTLKVKYEALCDLEKGVSNKDTATKYSVYIPPYIQIYKDKAKKHDKVCKSKTGKSFFVKLGSKHKNSHSSKLM